LPFSVNKEARKVSAKNSKRQCKQLNEKRRFMLKNIKKEIINKSSSSAAGLQTKIVGTMRVE
jgi:single-stranded DNA-specific DHH superfamily exonuclease